MKTHFSAGTLRCLFVLLALAVGAAAIATPKYSVLYGFSGGMDGGNPASGVIMDSAGNLYGTAEYGGNANDNLGFGTVFELNPSNGGWTESVLYTFTGGNDGGRPNGSLVFENGSLFGTANEGGSANQGVVFELTPSNGGWIETAIYSFTDGADGGHPQGGIVFDTAGNLYGTASAGAGTGCSGEGCGTVYELSPSDDSWQESTLYTFTGGNDGGMPDDTLILDKKGNLYGTTYGGGIAGGIIFQLERPAAPANTPWPENVLYSFLGGTDGADPWAGVVADSSDHLYGTTTIGGADGKGTAYELTYSKGSWAETIMHSFTSGNDGANPWAGLTLDPKGDLIGTTIGGGSNEGGTLFGLVPSNGGWKLKVIWSFTQNSGDHPSAGTTVILRPGKKLYGTATFGDSGQCKEGGYTGCGTVYGISIQ